MSARAWTQGRVLRTWLAAAALAAPIATTGCRGRLTEAPDLDDVDGRIAALERRLARKPADKLARRELATLQWAWKGDAKAARATVEPLIGTPSATSDPLALAIAVAIADGRRELAQLAPLTWALVDRAVAEGDRDGLTAALVSYAVRRMLAHEASVPGAEAAFVAAYDRRATSLTALPYAAWQPLISHRAALARLREEPWRPYFEAEGCVQSWVGGPVEGSLGARDVAKVDVRSPALPADPTAAITPLSCASRVWNPTPRAGVRRLQARLLLPEGVGHLQVSSDAPLRLYVDGQLVDATDAPTRFVADERRYTIVGEPGVHRVDVVLAVPEESTWLLLRATDGDLRPLAAADPAQPLAGGEIQIQPWTDGWELAEVAWRAVAGPAYEPVRAYFATDAALAAGDSDSAEARALGLRAHASGRGAGWGDGPWLIARFEALDPSRGATVSRARQRQALEAAVAADPGLHAARLELLTLALGRGETQDVGRELDALPAGVLRDVDGELLRWRYELARGSEHLAEQALARAAALHPGHCDVLSAQKSQAIGRDDVRREDALVAALAHCAGTLQLRASHADRRGRADEAEALLLAALERQPDNAAALQQLATMHARREQDARSAAVLGQLVALNPFRVDAVVAQADLRLRQGDAAGARSLVRAALDQVPQAAPLRRAAQTLGVPDDLWDQRVDGLEPLRSYLASGWGQGQAGAATASAAASDSGAAQVLVLDRSVTRIYPQGGSRTIVHNVVHLRAKEALDEYGELQLPEDAEVLTLRTIKLEPGGELRVVEPEVVPGKDGVSLRDLAVGDFVEFEFVQGRDPLGLLPGHVDAGAFRFQSLDVPFFRSELVVVAPKDLPLREDRRNDPPPARVEPAVADDGSALLVRSWKAERMERVGLEPGVRALVDEVPNVRVFTTLDLGAWLESVALQVQSAQRTNPELRAQVDALVGDVSDPGERLLRLRAWVMEAIEDGDDLTAPVTVTLASRRGNRLMLLRAMARQAGLRAELWLARNGYGPAPLAGGHPLVEAYEAPMLAVWLPGASAPQIVLTASDVLPIGYVAPPFIAGGAVRVHVDGDDGPAGPVELPAVPERLHDARHYELALTFDRDGNAQVQGVITLQGMEAVAWRQALREIDADRVDEAFEQAELGRLFRAATLGELTIEQRDALDLPLRLVFRATAPSAAIREGGELVLGAGVVPMNSAIAYTGLPARKTGLVIGYAPRISADLTIAFEGAQLVEAPTAAVIESPWGTFRREVARGPGGRSLTVRQRAELRAGVVTPADYAELSRLREAIDGAESERLRARPEP